jgi:hypothetical protein
MLLMFSQLALSYARDGRLALSYARDGRMMFMNSHGDLLAVQSAGALMFKSRYCVPGINRFILFLHMTIAIYIIARN